MPLTAPWSYAMVDLMETLDDDDLVRRIRAGEQDAFVALIRRYERSMATVIRGRLGRGVEAVEDVLQETLVHAWLYQVARNRCSDHLRSTQRRERLVDDETLAVLVNRLGIADARRRDVAADVVETFAAVPERERQALESFYVDGLSIAEIAARHRLAPGTIKRRLSHGRDRVRGELGIKVGTRRVVMNENTSKDITPFPAQRPGIVIEKLDGEARAVDMRELAWWFVVPELGDAVRWSEYQPTNGGSDWRLTETTAMQVRRSAVLHERECVEVEVDQQGYPVAGVLAPPLPDRTTKVWGRLTDSEGQWLGSESLATDDTRKLYTFLDDHFDIEFGHTPRSIAPHDCLVEHGEGAFERTANPPGVFANGTFSVRIDERTFACTRIVDMEPQATEQDVVVVAYVDERGRTVLFRRFDGNRRVDRGSSKTRTDLLPHAGRLTIDGMTFVHSYDYLSGDACGIGEY